MVHIQVDQSTLTGESLPREAGSGRTALLLLSSVADIAVVSVLATRGILMEALAGPRIPEMSPLTNQVNHALTGENQRDKDQGLQLGQR